MPTERGADDRSSYRIPGVVDPQCDFSDEELRVAEYLHKVDGVEVERRVTENRFKQKSHDSFVIVDPRGERVRHRVEFKSPELGADSATVRNEVNKGKKQARYVLIDGRGTGLTLDDAERGSRRAWGAYGDKLDAIRIIGDGFDVRWPPEVSP